MLNLARSWAATAISRSRAATPASSSARLLLGQAGSGRGISAGTCCATNVGSHMSDNDPQALQHHKEQSLKVVQQLHHTGEEGMPAMPKNHEQDVSASPAHAANLEHTRKNDTGSDPR
ncbi:hypothetical protein TSOC_010630 [Tetrabaena socialis]|uniref:Uncharacterized protein n=1 Tax=Tetrabaena socialis TaxID=47790 RepID=A0A2J7ZST5_9CHLO|nr:hypothetical protein TSOC_010630 [Tetrabaena socialis]|eukprot:PNH03322.1 hypothetical protein TSOC_010630 [Tetrabaena socialis]